MYYVQYYSDGIASKVFEFKNLSFATKFARSLWSSPSKYMNPQGSTELDDAGNINRIFFKIDTKEQYFKNFKIKDGAKEITIFIDSKASLHEARTESNFEGNDLKEIVSAASILGKKGGSSNSKLKKIASRENGKLGGRPKKKK